MEHHKGKMVRKYECQQCGSSFSKLGLLLEHRRVLGHEDVLPCNICNKTFRRKDNLERHIGKHNKYADHQCSLCQTVFSRKDSLQRHVQQNHNQYGGSLKRSAVEDSKDQPIPKKRLTQKMNPENFYTLKVLKETNVPKFRTKATSYKVTFQELEVRGLPDILKTIKRLFQSIINNITEFMESSDIVRFSVQCPELDFPITIPFIRVSHLNSDRLLSEIERVLQSFEQFVLDESLDIEIVHVSLPSGGVGKRCRFVNIDKLIQTKKCFIQINNKDDLCCARAIVTAKARLDDHPKCESIRHGGKLQTVLAEDLHREAGVPLQRCGISEIKSFQEVVTGYQIHIISKDHFNGIIYSGPEAEKRIYLYHHGEHYDVIISMPAFLGRSYFCVKCNSGYQHLSRHHCNDPCTLCHNIHDERDEDWKYCQVCNRNFRNTSCYEFHKKKTRSGNSMCNTYYKCKECDQTINRTMHKKIHKCHEHYCKRCKDFYDDNHQCYMQISDERKTKNKPDTKEKSNDLTYIFFDFECTQEDRIECDDGFRPNEENGKCTHCNKAVCGSFQHKPNLCVAHKVCQKCMLNEVKTNSTCTVCGQNEWVFRGSDAATSFCQWLFSEPNYGAKVFAHNFRGYDSIPIMSYLYENAILPKVIATGSKYLSVEVQQCNIKFLDSLNFLPMRLADLPGVFDLQEMTKGYFPHLYNKKENENMILIHLPEMKYYNPDGMKPEDREVFMKWYSDNYNNTFDFQEEILRYCRLDVDILRQACVKFRQLFLEIKSKSILLILVSQLLPHVILCSEQTFWNLKV